MFVTGCHRSGTSLLASLLHDCLPQKQQDQEHLVPAMDNPQGFFESRRLVDLNNEMLTWIGSEWYRPSLSSPLWDRAPLLDLLVKKREQLRDLALNHCWVDKDPRLCITYPAYLHLLLRRVPIVSILREPLDVATSLYARNGTPVDCGLAIWFLYNHLLSISIDQQDYMIGYNELLEGVGTFSTRNTYHWICEVLEQIQVPKPTDFTWQQISDSRLRPELNRAASALPQTERSKVDLELLKVLEQAYKLIREGGFSIEDFKFAFNSMPYVVLNTLFKYQAVSFLDPRLVNQNQTLRNTVSDLERQRDTQIQQLTELNTTLKSAQQRELALQDKLHCMQASSSWKITSPLRQFGDFFRS